jgi:outer membrane protein TolC
MKNPHSTFTIKNTFAIAALLLFTTAFVQAQEKKVLSVEEAVRTGIENSNTLSISRMKVKAAEERAGEISASRLPSLKFQGGYTRLSDVPPFVFTPPFPNATPITIAPVILDNYTLKLSAAQPVFTGFKLESLQEAAQYNSKAAQSDLAKDKVDLVWTIRNAYWNLYKAMEFRKLAEENLSALKAHLKDVEAMYAAGMITQNDVLKVQVQVADADYRRLEVRNQAQVAMVGLNNLLRLPLNTELELSSRVNNQKRSLESLDSYLQKAMGTRPDITSAEMRVKAGQEGITAAKAAWYPQVNVFAEYNYNNPNQRIVPARSQFDGTWAAGVQLSMDVWNWGQTTKQTNQAEAQLAQAQEALSLTKDGIAVEVTQAWITVAQSYEKLPVTEKAIAQAQENYRVISERFKNGTATSTDVTDAETALTQARINYTQAVVDYEIAALRLQKAMGLE